MDYNQALSYLNKYDANTIKLGLDRMREVMSRLGNPEAKLRFVHVTGTNGKGSTIAMLRSILQRAGYRVGVFTSPHLVKINESITVVEGYPISDQAVALAVDNSDSHAGGDISNADLAGLVDEVAGILGSDILAVQLTKFELLTAMAIYYFAKSRCDIVLLEVGMGGEGDSTNIVTTTDVAIITKISLDHCAYLGGTVGEIAAVKAGIIKAGCGVIIAPQDFLEVYTVIEAASEGCSAEVIKVGADYCDYYSEADGQKFSTRGRKDITMGMLGQHQVSNAMTAIAAAEYMTAHGYNITESAIRQGLAVARWGCRLEKISDAPRVFVDGGHNIDGVNAVVEYFENCHNSAKFVTIFGVLRDKEYRLMIDRLGGISSEVVAVEPLSSRALPRQAIVEICNSSGIKACAMELDSAIEYALQSGGDVLIIGSLYYVGIAKEIALAKLGGLK